jgi:vacuolar-type H+-ATPase subunit C/Vma6
MDRSGSAEYVYAKSCGMLAKSFVGDRAARLFTVKSLSELWELFFKTPVPSMPETLLARKIEQEAEKKFIDDYSKLLKCYIEPEVVLVTLLQLFDYSNLKEIGAALCYKNTVMPDIADIHQYRLLNYRAWPNIQKMTEHSVLAWYNKVPDIHEQQQIDTRLDIQYISQLWNAVQQLPESDHDGVVSFIKKEISMQSVLWAIRLKVYYRMSTEEVSRHLVYAGGAHTSGDTFASEALKILDKPVDSWDAWKDWKYAAFLNPHEEGVVWEIDPRWIERMFKIRLNEHALMEFHRDPFSLMVPVAWFKIKQHELDCVRTVVEGLRLNIDGAQSMSFAGVASSEKYK